jgi:tetratricopeptide (TPR) repeat protein
MEESVKLFISYSHRDEALRQQLDKHLAPLKRQKVIEAWHDRQIPAGTEWANEIDENLRNADIVLLLVSPDFVASDYCSNTELEIAMSRHQQGAAIIIPVVLEPCDWSWLPFAKFQAFPKDALAVTSWPNQNEAFLNVATGIRKVAQDILAQRQGQFQQKEANQEKYKAKVEQVLSVSNNGEISVADRDTLEELRESLGLTTAETQEAEDSAYQPFVDRTEKQEKYKKTLLKYIENYPFSEDITKQLENRQRDLGLKNEDIVQVTQPILAEAEKRYQETLQATGVEQQLRVNRQADNLDISSLNTDDQRNDQEAIECYRKAIELDPNNAITHNDLGLSWYYQGQDAEAIKSYRKAIELDPNNAIFYSNLGLSLQNQGQDAEAIESYRKAIELDPNDAFAHNNLGLSFSAQGKDSEAIEHYQKAIELDPSNATIHGNLGFSLSNQGRYEEATKSYQKAIEIDPSDANLHGNFGLSLHAQEKDEEAIKYYRKAIEIDPNNATFYSNLGFSLAAQEKHTEAIECYRKAIKIDPNNAIIHSNLGLSLQAQD